MSRLHGSPKEWGVIYFGDQFPFGVGLKYPPSPIIGSAIRAHLQAAFPGVDCLGHSATCRASILSSIGFPFSFITERMSHVQPAGRMVNRYPSEEDAIFIDSTRYFAGSQTTSLHHVNPVTSRALCSVGSAQGLSTLTLTGLTAEPDGLTVR
ncbi:hypothetical protein AFLA_011513 [Aspergillus flavus NRRL3357]|nr:hypothetical protein AFLA_011513 [Aspergillus flavus NRRL3357]